jgi:hypothetical protein
MGLDGSTLEVADEVANANHFGYPGASRGAAAFPQLRFCALAECGTQVLIGAKVGTYATGEQTLAHQVLDHAVGVQMLVGPGESVEAGQTIAIVHASDDWLAGRAEELLGDAWVITGA